MAMTERASRSQTQELDLGWALGAEGLPSTPTAPGTAVAPSP